MKKKEREMVDECVCGGKREKRKDGCRGRQKDIDAAG
jgi:hypothetical protein